MASDWSKSLGGRLLGAVLTVAGVIVVIWYWRLGPEQRADMWSAFRGALLWLGLVAVLPWALFFVPPRVIRAESNLASAVMLVAYLIADLLLALYLAGGMPDASWQRAMLVLGLLCAGVYNFVVCESIAQRAERTY